MQQLTILPPPPAPAPDPDASRCPRCSGELHSDVEDRGADGLLFVWRCGCGWYRLI